MRLTQVRSSCPDTESCPALYWTDRNTVVVQGVQVLCPEVVGARPLAPGEGAVEVPAVLVDGLAIGSSTLYPTERGTILVLGSVVTDMEALAILHLPADEAAVEIHLSVLPSLTEQEVGA